MDWTKAGCSFPYVETILMDRPSAVRASCTVFTSIDLAAVFIYISLSVACSFPKNGLVQNRLGRLKANSVPTVGV